jgi:hypothetical protein
MKCGEQAENHPRRSRRDAHDFSSRPSHTATRTPPAVRGPRSFWDAGYWCTGLYAGRLRRATPLGSSTHRTARPHAGFQIPEEDDDRGLRIQRWMR